MLVRDDYYCRNQRLPPNHDACHAMSGRNKNKGRGLELTLVIGSQAINLQKRSRFKQTSYMYVIHRGERKLHADIHARTRAVKSSLVLERIYVVDNIPL